MWIYLNDSMLSVVMDQNNVDNLTVRARRAGDLEAIFPEACKQVLETPDSDYGFRISINRQEVAAAIAKRLLGIAYPNFKASVEDESRGDVYGRVWLATLTGFSGGVAQAHEVEELRAMGQAIEYFCHKCGQLFDEEPEGECPGP